MDTCDILIHMLRLRRTLAFGARVHNYLLLLYLFSFSLFAAQLWWDTTDQFTQFATNATTLLSMVGLAYALVLLLIAVVLWLFDRMFPVLDVLATFIRCIVFVSGWVVISIFTEVTQHGFMLFV